MKSGVKLALIIALFTAMGLFNDRPEKTADARQASPALQEKAE